MHGALASGSLSAPNSAPLPAASPDYDHVRRAIEFVSLNWRNQPGIEAVADHAGISASHLNHVFRRWCGLSPKDFLAAVTLNHARDLLRADAPILDAAFELGMSGPGRLHDLFVTHEKISPGEFKARGAGLTITWGVHASPFGAAIVLATARGLCGLAFADDGEETAAFADMAGRWPNARFERDDARTASLAARVFDAAQWDPKQPLRVVLIGSDFEIRVWETLLGVPFGRGTTYAAVARQIGKPAASRAVGSAVGRNPISFVVPCHRVVGSNGSLCGYHWGLTRKRAILGWEGARLSGAVAWPDPAAA
jgi:AraC family transcriptional regulator, regulatory protein of adaptative response / methylated-DNA-[protein]-cysteine methyltransferase